MPLAYFVIRTYQGLEQEEVATLSYFAETLFDDMERALASIVQREEGRAVDEYNITVFPSGRSDAHDQPTPSPLSQLSKETYILGYFQNNPDGTFQTPLVEGGSRIPPNRLNLVEELKQANEIFNQKRVTVTDRIKPQPAEILTEKEDTPPKGFADKYIASSRNQRSRAFLGQKEKRLEQITIDQALNIAKQDQSEMARSVPSVPKAEEPKRSSYRAKDQAAGKVVVSKKSVLQESYSEESVDFMEPTPSADSDDAPGYQVEVAPLQAVFLSDSQVFIFRRIMINSQIYRQGFVLMVKPFLEYLANTYFSTQPMAQFTGLQLRVMDQGRETGSLIAGVAINRPNFTLNRGFPSPFGFLSATLICDEIPRATGRRTLTIMLVVLAVIVLLGFFAIYQSARTIVDLSERRSQFVSSVTHELKTPLTNIRMYIEMLEQGIARNPEREQEYFQILDSEGARLSRLINNVLELSKLEKNQRHIDLHKGTFEEVVTEVQTVMAEKLKQEGFSLILEPIRIQPFNYDREVMIQVLINLIENSLKFCKSADKKEIRIQTLEKGGTVKIMVSDTGPGIPKHALKKIFNDFYRVDNSLTRTTRGTGIGLALVKKFVNLMGGTVIAENNLGPGCTITICLPA
jgi:signal transduction histidine kinase